MSQLVMGDDGKFHCATCEPDAAQPRSHEPAQATTVYRAVEGKAVRVVFQDGERRDGRVSDEDWERIKDGKLQSFVLDVTEPHHTVKREAVIRWWCCRSVEEMV